AGFYPAWPLPRPAAATDTAWARLTNVTGLVAGASKLGDELALLFSWDTIAASAFMNMLQWTWNGSTFAATPSQSQTTPRPPDPPTGGAAERSCRLRGAGRRAADKVAVLEHELAGDEHRPLRIHDDHQPRPGRVERPR